MLFIHIEGLGLGCRAPKEMKIFVSALLAAQRQSISQRKEVAEAPLVSEAACGGLEKNGGWGPL